MILGTIILIVPFNSFYGQYLDTVHKTELQHEYTYSYNWDHNRLTSVSELRDSNKLIYGWTYLQFKQYDESFNVINEKKYTDSTYFTVGHRSLTFYQDSYYFPNTDVSYANDTFRAAVVKFDTLGNIIWKKKYFVNDYKAATYQVVKQNSNLYIYGWHMENIGDPWEVFIIESDTSGTVLQIKNFPGPTESPILLYPTLDGGFLMSNDFNQPNVDTKIYKLNSNLNITWTKTINSSIESTIVSAREISDGSIIFYGGSADPVNSTSRSYIGKLNSSGQLIKDSIYDLSDGFDILNYNGNVIWGDNGFYVAGGIYDNLTADTAKASLCYFDYDLNLIWHRKYSNRVNENSITSLTQLDNGYIALSGYVLADDSNSTADEWFMVVDSLGCANIECNASLSIHYPKEDLFHNIVLYPNPASKIVSVKYESLNLDGAIYQIYNSLGQLSKSGNIDMNQIDVSSLRNGHYSVNIDSNNEHYRSTLIISR